MPKKTFADWLLVGLPSILILNFKLDPIIFGIVDSSSLVAVCGSGDPSALAFELLNKSFRGESFGASLGEVLGSRFSRLVSEAAEFERKLRERKNTVTGATAISTVKIKITIWFELKCKAEILSTL